MIALAMALIAARPELVVGFDFSLFRPGVDAAFGDGATPYQDIFGDGRHPFFGGRIGGAIEEEHFGLALTAQIGRRSTSAKALRDDLSGGPTGSTDRSGGETGLVVVPISMSLEVSWRSPLSWWRVPVMPYLRAGPIYASWSVSKGDGATVASGATWGLGLGAGLRAELEHLDRKARVSLQDDFAIQGVAITLGVWHSWLDGFGRGDVLVLSDTAPYAGFELSF